MNTKSFSAEFKAVPETEGVVTAVVSVFGVTDHANERVMPGAFAKQIAEGRLPKVVMHHDWHQPVGKVIDWEEAAAGDPRLPEKSRPYGGLLATFQLNMEKQSGKDAYSDLKGGFLTEFSFGYRVMSDGKADDGVRELKELDVAELSPVLRGCNPATSTVAVKAADPQVSEVKASDPPCADSIHHGLVYALLSAL